MAGPVGHALLTAEEGHVACILGNEAIVRGALEAGVGFACGYPGTPSSEITDTFARLADDANLAFEYSVNEKIALEMAFAASLGGARSICAMKHLGLMSAGDPLTTIPYIGVEAGMVIVSAGDPSCRTSPNEQDQRHLGAMLHLPVLDPSTPADALYMTRFAFELSEETRLPVLLRVTTRVCHSKANVTFGARRLPEVRGFKKDPRRYVPIPVNARRMRLEINDRIARARAMMDRPELFQRQGSSRTAVLAAGAPAATCSDVMQAMGIADEVALWRLGAVHPIPEASLVAALREVDTLLVLEELSPFLEETALGICSHFDIDTKILGKHTGHVPGPFELEPAIIQQALHDALGLGPAPTPREPAPELAPRPPSMCPGCVHRASFLAARAAFPDDQLFFNDIGCYTLGYGAPLATADAVLCMGAGFTLAAGVARVTGQQTVGFMGDGTFFHSGIPALLNAIKEGARMVAIILDNEVTAMTGFQKSPDRSEHHRASIEGVARALGAPHVEVVDPYNLQESTAALERAREQPGVSVVIMRHGCPVHAVRQLGRTAAPMDDDPEEAAP